jgi:sulfoxide reductase heme-binding subunit YedZ
MTNALWYLARGSGVVTLALLTVVMVVGIASRSGRPAFGLPRFAVGLVHRNAALLALVFLVMHITTLLLDPYAQLKLVDLVLPFHAGYRPAWVGLGTLVLDLMVALVATSLLRHRLGIRAWRTVHWLAYAAWPIAWAHGIGSGTDRGTGWYAAFAIGCTIAVGVALIWRIGPGFATLGGRREPVRPARRGAAPPAPSSAAYLSAPSHVTYQSGGPR